MGLKEFVLGHTRYCVTDKNNCVDKCFPTKAEAKRYRKEHCDCGIQKQTQRKPFTCKTSKCHGERPEIEEEY